MHQIRSDELDKYKSFRRASFPNDCPVCNEPLRFESDLCLLPSNDETNPKTRIIYPQRQTYYGCECSAKNHAWLAYTPEGLIEKIKQGIGQESYRKLKVVTLDIGHKLALYHLLSDFHRSQGITDENNLYHHLHHNYDDIIYIRVPIDEILLTPYIRKLTHTNSKKAKEIEKEIKQRITFAVSIIDLATSLSLLSIMNFHNLDIPTFGKWIDVNLSSWLGFETEIKDLFIYSGPAFWEHIKVSMLANSIVTCLSSIELYGEIVNDPIAMKEKDELKILKEVRDRFIAHFDMKGKNEKTQGYIESLYSLFNELVENFNTEHNKEPYYLYIDLPGYHYKLPVGHTPCDNAFRNVLRLIHSQYERYIKGE